MTNKCIFARVQNNLFRYTAVSKPLEQRTRNAQFSVRAICAGIALGAFLLNMVVVPFERTLSECYEFTQNGFDSNIMIAQEEIVNNQYYAIRRFFFRILDEK